jgi:menaquinone-specific isochorismate synthase
LEVDVKASLLRLANKQHLFSQVTADLLDDVSDGELVDRLHPTPAVGGYPTENALDEIRRLESFQRGWYAAPVGWIGADEAEFAVAIRSGVVQAERLTLYSGAGIVPGSTAAAEWDEIEQKISDFLSLLKRAESDTRAVTT